MTQQQQLRAMTAEQQREWMLANARLIRSVGLFTVKVDSVLVCCGADGEEDAMFDTFHAAVNGPEIVQRTGGMG